MANQVSMFRKDALRERLAEFDTPLLEGVWLEF
jgi:hypothetical protein